MADASTNPVDTSVLDYQPDNFQNGARAESSIDEAWGKLPFPRWKNVGRVVPIFLTDSSTTPAVGDSAFSFIVPELLDGAVLIHAEACVTTVSAGSGPISIQLNIGGSDLFTTALTIDDNEKTSKTAATPVVIDAVKGVVYAGNQIDIDIDDIGDGNATGWHLYLYFQ